MRREAATFWLLFHVISVNGFDLQCTFKNLDHGFTVAVRTGCHATNVDIKSPNQVVTSVNGKDLKNFSGSGYKSIEIRRQSVHFIPQGLGIFFPDLEGLAIHTSHTKKVTKNDLAQFPNLKQLYLYSTDIQSLPADLFEGNPELLYIYFSNNKLTHVGKGILTPLTKLHTAYFSGNPCINIEVVGNQSQISSIVTALESGCRNDTIDELNSIHFQRKSTSACDPIRSPTACIDELKRKLESKEKLLATCTRHIFMNPSTFQEKSSLVSTQTIDIKCNFDSVDSSCEVFEFVVDTPGSKIAEIFHVNGTKIDQSSSLIKKIMIIDQQALFLPQNLAEMLPKVTDFLIVDSGFFKIEKETFSGFSLLKSLNITQNKIREIPDQLMNENSNLKDLNLTSNKIEMIAEKAFDNLGNLEELDLSHNLLTSVPSKVFSALISLKTLKINNNKLQFLSPKLFYELLELVSFDISNNQIEKLESDMISASNKISEFHAANNKLKIIDLIFMKRLKKSQLIDFSGNDCINAIYDKNLTTSVTLNFMVTEIFLQCTDDGELLSL